MKTKKVLLVAALSFVIAFTSIIPVFANGNEESTGGCITIEKESIDNNGTITNGLVMNKDGQIDAVRPSSIFGTEIYVGTLTVTSWIGTNVTFTIKVRSMENAIKKHTGTIEFYKVNSLGMMGNIFNSMTFYLHNGAGTRTMTDTYTMNAQSNTKIYIKLTNMRVEDIFGDILALTDCKKRFNKSDFSL